MPGCRQGLSLVFLGALLALAGCAAEVADDGGGGLLTPDNADNVRWGEAPPPEAGEPPPPTNPTFPTDDPELVKNPGHSGSTSECGTVIESEAFRLLNEDRKKEGLSLLQCDDDLLIVARLHSKDMFVRGYFDHVNPDGERPWDRMTRHGVHGWNMVGENIAAGQRSPAEVEEAWMNSPGHRANILTAEFTHVGVAYFEQNGQTFWTQLFARF